ncbi:hypothetical protein CONLIGDRAFT_694077 [Coniochaeta ligniaria NRRL 30616]|uniref:Uncharacterized protein n=1 Tax=Coniochaeta ligniaria NRRL 30616 TaxID=1408157 RepID=A0A1J7IPT4_9PEZI|nr:hypothetical protein CONLIGDRAFT_694077 [Coniochaeta ligniaria NRRL 30616]
MVVPRHVCDPTLVLSAFGIFSEVVSTSCSKRLLGHASMLYATCVIMILSYLVWRYHSSR